MKSFIAYFLREQKEISNNYLKTKTKKTLFLCTFFIFIDEINMQMYIK